MLVCDLIRLGAIMHGDRTAVLSGDATMRFAEVDRLSDAMATALAEFGATGTMVGLLVSNGPLSIPLDFACAKAGVVRVPLNARLSQTEHAAMIRRVGARLLIHSCDLTDRAAALAAEVADLALLPIERVAADAGERRATLPAPGPDDPVLASFTSGTTGTLKAVVHTQASWAACALNVLDNLIDPRPGDTLLHAASLFHASGCLVLPCWLRGATTAVLPGFEPEAYLAAVDRWRPTSLLLVPTMIAMLLDHPRFDPDRFASVDTLLYGASPMPPALMERTLDAFGPRLVQFYGQTEAPLAIAALRREDHLQPARLTSCGRPGRDVDLRIDAPPGSAGEIELRAPFVMAGYYDEPELTAATFTRDGWLRTRDIGRLDDDGYLTLVDRTSDMIVTGGYNVYPAEVENALLAHPAVREAVVVGVPDDRWGEAVMAFAVLRDGASADPAMLREHCRGLIAGYKLPKEVRFIDAIPTSAVGKPLRRALRDPFWTGRTRSVG